MSINFDKLDMPVKNVTDYEKIQTPEKVATQSRDNVNNLNDKNNPYKNNKSDDKGKQGSDKGRTLSKETLDSAFSGMNSKLKMQRTRCEYEIDDETKKVSIKVYDKDTNELVLEAPPEESIEAFKKTLELAGILVDKKS